MLGDEKLAVDATVRTLQDDARLSATMASFSTETAAIRVKFNEDPATAVGQLITNGDQCVIYGNDAIRAARFVEATSTDSVINVTYGTYTGGMHGLINYGS